MIHSLMGLAFLSFYDFSNKVLWKDVSIFKNGLQFLATILLLRIFYIILRLKIPFLSFMAYNNTKAFLGPNPDTN